MKRIKGKCKWCGKRTSMFHDFFEYYRCRKCLYDGRKAIFDRAKQIAVEEPWMHILDNSEFKIGESPYWKKKK